MAIIITLMEATSWIQSILLGQKIYGKKEEAFVNRWIYDYSGKRRKDDSYTLESRFFPEKLNNRSNPCKPWPRDYNM